MGFRLAYLHFDFGQFLMSGWRSCIFVLRHSVTQTFCISAYTLPFLVLGKQVQVDKGCTDKSLTSSTFIFKVKLSESQSFCHCYNMTDLRYVISGRHLHVDHRHYAVKRRSNRPWPRTSFSMLNITNVTAFATRSQRRDFVALVLA